MRNHALTYISDTPGRYYSDSLGRYYTADEVSRLLITEMQVISPKLIVDFGVGRGALTKAAVKRWTEAKFITVDIDFAAYAIGSEIGHHQHHVGDVLSHNLHKEIGIELGSVDAAICNPPYIKPDWKEDFSTILKEAGLDGVISNTCDVTADILFIAQNIRFVKDNGKIGLIVPDGIVAGDKFLEFRRKLLNNHRIDSVIELPRNIFSRTEAKTHIVIITKNANSTNQIKLTSFENFDDSEQILLISHKQAIRRMDYSYYKFEESLGTGGSSSLRKYVQDIKRGNLNSREVRASSRAIFHSTSFPKKMNGVAPAVPSEFILDEKEIGGINTIVASEGDILICRVGRNLEQKICFVPFGHVAISDCIFRLRVEPQMKHFVLRFLVSTSGQNALANLSHGVGAKYITIEDLLDLRIPDESNN